jgi:hypothetical protein
MEKQILLELHRIKQIMGYDRSNPKDFIFEQDFEGGDGSVEFKPRTEIGNFEEYKTLEIGPESNKEYPTIMAVPIKIVYDPYKGPELKKFQPGTTAKSFVSNVKTFSSGEQLSDGTPAPEGVEYIELEDKKLCLPSKEFWDEVHVKNQYIYQFKNPKTESIFTMRLSLLPEGKAFIDNIPMSGKEAAMKCKGGKNGWVFKMNENGMVFFKKGTLEAYGGAPEELETKSDFDTWWDSGWGIAIEVGVGILASIVSGGIAGVLLSAARFGRIAGWLGRTILYLDKLRYLGGSTTLLTVITESLVEAGLMIPIAIYQSNRGNDSDAVLAIALSFLPFFTNVPAVSKAIKTGKVFRRTDAEKIMQKVQAEGGFEVLDESKEKTATFLLGLTDDQQEMYKTAVTMLKESPAEFEKGLIEVFNKEGDVIADNIAKNKNLDKSVSQKVIDFAKENVSVRSGTGILPQFVRAGVPIAGLFVMPTVMVFNYLKSKGLSDNAAGELTNQYTDAVANSEYIKKLNKLHEKLGLGTQQSEKVVIETLQNLIEKNPEITKDVMASDVVQKKYFDSVKVDEEAKLVVKKDENTIIDAMYNFNNDLESLNIVAELKIIDKRKAIGLITSEKGFTINSWDDTNNEKLWKFITNNNEKGEVKFEGDKYFIIINGKTINT